MIKGTRENDTVYAFFGPEHFMGNWYPAPFVMDGNHYATAEHGFMAGKALLFGDDVNLARILKTTSPRYAKICGRKVAGFTDAVWDQNKYDIMLRVSRAKYEQNPELAAALVATHPKQIAEGSPYDKVWGTGRNISVLDPAKWVGQNLLGRVLMQVRDELINKK